MRRGVLAFRGGTDVAGVVFDACRRRLAPAIYKNIILFKKDRRGRRSLQDLIVVPILSSVGEDIILPFLKN